MTADGLRAVNGTQVVDPVGQLCVGQPRTWSPFLRVGLVLSGKARGRDARCTPVPKGMSLSSGPGPLRETTVMPGSPSIASRADVRKW